MCMGIDGFRDRGRLILSPLEALLLVDGCIEGKQQTVDSPTMVHEPIEVVDYHSKDG